MENAFEEVVKTPQSRRAFLARMGAAGLGVAASSLLGGTLLAGCGGGSGGIGGGGGAVGNSYPAAFGAGDIRILNYALTLEILEADLYRQALNAASQRALTSPLVPIANARATYTNRVGSGGLNGNLTAAGFLYLLQFAYVEAAHRDFLRVAIQGNGGTPVQPNKTGYRFPGGSPGADLRAILNNIVPLEETGVRAYLGAVPDFASNAFLQVAGTIYSTEARHSASLRYILDPTSPGPSRMAGDREVTPNPPSQETFEKFFSVQEVLSAAQNTYFA